jgi:hypothetical protein
MTTASIALQESNLGYTDTANGIILGSGLLINRTVSLGDIEPTIKMYEMLGCATIL